MKVRTAIARTAPRTRRTAIGWAFLGILVFAATSACSPSGTTTLPPTSGSASLYTGATSGAASNADETATETQTATTTPTATPTITITVTATPNYSPIPTAAPVTGGGGTAGLQDGVLFLIGGAAIVVGVGSIAYRRRLNKDR